LEGRGRIRGLRNCDGLVVRRRRFGWHFLRGTCCECYRFGQLFASRRCFECNGLQIGSLYLFYCAEMLPKAIFFDLHLWLKYSYGSFDFFLELPFSILPIIDPSIYFHVHVAPLT